MRKCRSHFLTRDLCFLIYKRNREFETNKLNMMIAEK